MSETTCQLCSKTAECQLVKCDTRYLHPKGWKFMGHQGTATLSVCAECGKKHGKGG